MFDNKCVEHTKSLIAKGERNLPTHNVFQYQKDYFSCCTRKSRISGIVGNSQQDLTGYTCFQLIVHSTGYNRFLLAHEICLFYIILYNVFKIQFNIQTIILS